MEIVGLSLNRPPKAQIGDIVNYEQPNETVLSKANWLAFGNTLYRPTPEGLVQVRPEVKA